MRGFNYLSMLAHKMRKITRDAHLYVDIWTTLYTLLRREQQNVAKKRETQQNEKNRYVIK